MEEALELELTIEKDLHVDEVTHNVYVFEGAVFPRQFIMVGAHRDSWASASASTTFSMAGTLFCSREQGGDYAGCAQPEQRLVLGRVRLGAVRHAGVAHYFRRAKISFAFLAACAGGEVGLFQQ